MNAAMNAPAGKIYPLLEIFLIYYSVIVQLFLDIAVFVKSIKMIVGGYVLFFIIILIVIFIAICVCLCSCLCQRFCSWSFCLFRQ